MPRGYVFTKEPRREIIFCTECGKMLENFCFSRKITNIKLIKKTAARCKKRQNHESDECAKLFIAQHHDIEETGEITSQRSLALM